MAAGIAFDAVDSDNGTISGGATYSFALTVAGASGQERLVLLAGIGQMAGSDYTACTIDGQTGTRVGTVVQGTSDGTAVRAFVTAYRATGTAATSISVVATNAGGGQCYAGYCACFKLSSADTVLATASSILNDPALSLNTASGGAAAAVVLTYANSVANTVTWTGLTENYDNVVLFGNDTFSAASADVATGATPRTVSADFATNITPGSGGASAAALSVSFNPDAGGATVVKQAAHHMRQMAEA